MSGSTREQVEALADAYAERHTAMENYIVSWAVLFALLRKLGIDPRSATGRIANFVIVVVLLVGAPIGVEAAAGDLENAPIATWTVVAALFALLSAAVYGPLRAAVSLSLSMHRLMRVEDGLRQLIAWDRRWFTVRASIPVVVVFSGAMVWLLLRLHGAAERPLPVGTIVVAALLLFEVGEVLYTVVMLGLESRIFEQHEYALYPLGPGDTVGLQRSLRGSNQIATLVGLVATIIIIGFAVLLAEHSAEAGRIAVALLAIAYLAIGFGVVLPRLAMKRIVDAEKDRRLLALQERIAELVPDGGERGATANDELKRLRETHDALRASGTSVLPMSSLGRVASSLVLPTLTFFFTEAGREIVRRVLTQLGR